VPQHVGERFLQDPVGGVIDARRQRHPLALDRHADRGARGTHRLAERLEPVEPGGPGLGPVDVGAAGAQLAQGGPHVGQGSLAGVPDRYQRVADPGGRTDVGAVSGRAGRARPTTLASGG
jgi:hypothetical protein